jgi:CDP-diacylglycerol--serine O-phosphatidyltransferase
MSRENVKYIVPNGITFAALALGIGAVIAAAEGNLTLSATLIFVSYWMDMLDGMAARKLDARSDFGLQLDSLVDIVNFGVAPAVLVYKRLVLAGETLWWVVPLVLVYAVAGAFRLARFNLLPPKKTGDKDSIGLAITQSAGTVALAVLADLVETKYFIPGWVYIPFVLILSVLMVSTIRFPPITWFFLSRRKGLLFLIVIFTLILVLPTYTTWFWIYIVYLGVTKGRLVYRRVRLSVPA